MLLCLTAEQFIKCIKAEYFVYCKRCCVKPLAAFLFLELAAGYPVIYHLRHFTPCLLNADTITFIIHF